jgi:hypothetical protein
MYAYGDVTTGAGWGGALLKTKKKGIISFFREIRVIL